MTGLARRIVVAVLVVAFLPGFVAFVLDLIDFSRSPQTSGDLLGVAVFGLFLLGLLVRVHRAIRREDPRARAHEERRERLAGRFLAEDLPLGEEEEPGGLVDPDPVLPDGEEEE